MKAAKARACAADLVAALSLLETVIGALEHACAQSKDEALLDLARRYIERGTHMLEYPIQLVQERAAELEQEESKA